MNAYILGVLAVAAAYLIGAIPFGFLTARWVRGIDIRTVGSGNIGATNVGRVLGFHFFVLVFLLDLLKGFLPTFYFPRLAAQYGGATIHALGVFVALATILGHNFPIYLKLRGGKGVATSLGALLALDWVSSVAAAVGFLTGLAVTGYVSLSSLMGGLVFLAVYFKRVDDPWNRDHLAMSVVTIGLVGLLFVRHRKNLARIRAGTEPKVSLVKKKPPAGRVAWVLIPILTAVAVGVVYGLAARVSQRAELNVGSLSLVEVDRVATGHQRTERVAFADSGRLLAVTCPRYNRLVLYRVTPERRLHLLRDVALDGRPMAVVDAGDRLIVLERPSGDRRHVAPGWWETFDLQGQSRGGRHEAGMYPDDLVLTPDRRHVLILTSGRGEGDPDRPAPALDVRELAGESSRRVGRLDFDGPGDDPNRLAISASGLGASVTLLGSNQVASIDLADPTHPKLLGRSPLPADAPAHLSFAPAEADAILMGLAPERDAVPLACSGPRAPTVKLLAATLPGNSGIVVIDAATRRRLGLFPLHAGALNLSVSRPMGLACSPERGLLAVASRSGSVHLIAGTLGASGEFPPAPALGPIASEATPLRR